MGKRDKERNLLLFLMDGGERKMKSIMIMIAVFLLCLSFVVAQDTELDIEVGADRDLDADIELSAGRDLNVNLDADNINVGGEVTLNDYSDNSVHAGGMGINDLNELIYSFLTRGKSSSSFIQDFIYLMGEIFVYKWDYSVLSSDHAVVSDRLDYLEARQSMMLNVSGIVLDEAEVLRQKCYLKARRLNTTITQDGITCKVYNE